MNDYIVNFDANEEVAMSHPLCEDMPDLSSFADEEVVNTEDSHEEREAPQLDKECIDRTCQDEGKYSDDEDEVKEDSLETEKASPSPPFGDTFDGMCCACSEDHPLYYKYPDIRSPPKEKDDWIGCDCCGLWLHQECVDLEPYEVTLIDTFACKKCELKNGVKTQLKKFIAPHRNKAEIVDGIDKPMEVGTKPWIESFIKKESQYSPPDSWNVVVLEDGRQFEEHCNKMKEWKQIFLVREKEGLGMKIPDEGTFDIDNLVDTLGEKYLVDTIDVYRQQTVRMSIGRFRDLLVLSSRARLYNILSIEFTETKLETIVSPPSFVYEHSWVHRYWPRKNSIPRVGKEICNREHVNLRPNVELYCIVTMKGSYTDFHIDFGGSSVWYHVYKGRKIFYVVEPSEMNMDIYKEYMEANDKELFMGDIFPCGTVKRVEVREGDTLVIPGGWIHAVYAPLDSIVFGGNFLNDYNIRMQLECNHADINTLKLDYRFIFPNFELIHFYAARTMTKTFKELNENKIEEVAEYMIDGGKAMVEYLNGWIDKEKENRVIIAYPYIHGESKPSILLRLKKELKTIEMRLQCSQTASRKRTLDEVEKEGNEEKTDESSASDGTTSPVERKKLREDMSSEHSYIDIVECVEMKKEKTEEEKTPDHSSIVEESLDNVQMEERSLTLHGDHSTNIQSTPIEELNEDKENKRKVNWLKEELPVKEPKRFKDDIVAQYNALEYAEMRLRRRNREAREERRRKKMGIHC